MAKTALTERLKKNFDEGCFTYCIRFDLSKTFNTVNYKMLLKKLQFYGSRGNMISVMFLSRNMKI